MQILTIACGVLLGNLVTLLIVGYLWAHLSDPNANTWVTGLISAALFLVSIALLGTLGWLLYAGYGP